MSGSGRCCEEASGNSYDVFISHAGVQKASFAVWLQRELRRHGVSAFLDETSLRLGDTADVEMEAALRSCSIVVAVLTPDFLRSAYCLQELHWALHPSEPHPPLLQSSIGPAESAAGSAPQLQPNPVLVKRSKGPPLLFPVFLHTSNLAALQKEMQRQVVKASRCCVPSAKLQRLQQASDNLATVCGCTGDRLDSHGRLDAEHVDAIVVEVLRRLDQPRFEAPQYAVDLGARVQELLPLLQPDQPGGVRMLSLHGMGGIGKTTLARELFDCLSSGGLRFSSRVFFEVGQDTVSCVTLLLDQQRQLIEALASSSVPKANSAAQQQQQLFKCIKTAGPLLLVLDNIWNTGQRDELLCTDALPEGSRVILTGRDSSKLHPDNPTLGWAARPVEALAAQQAEQLLCRHAFAIEQAPPEYATTVRQALAVCDGLPLALQVVGAGMRSQLPATAEDGVRHLLAQPTRNLGRTDATGDELTVLKLLQWSFDRLPSDNHKHFFLDAALLMRGQPHEHLLQTWVGVLQQDEEEDAQHLSAPEQLRHRAEALWAVCEGATLLTCRASKGERHSRVQAHDCIVEMAEAVCTPLAHPASWSLSNLSATTPLPQAGSRKARASRLRCGPAGASGMPRPSWTLCQLLSRHRNCRLAAVDLQHTWKGSASSYGQIRKPSQLLYLRLTAVPQQWSFGGQLRVLDVVDHGDLEFDLPNNIAACSALRQLRLGIEHLQSMPDSIGSLASLVTLDLSCCEALQQLPNSIGRLASLVTLDVNWCKALQQLPDSIGRLASLVTLDVSGCQALQRLPDSIGCLASLVTLNVNGCFALQQLPDSIGMLASLRTLDVSECEALQRLPDSISRLTSLETLDVKSCKALQRLPDSIGSHTSLYRLDFSNCTALQQLPDSIGSLAGLLKLDVSCCEKLQRLPDSIGHLASLMALDINGCIALQRLPDSIGHLASLVTLDVSMCEALQRLPDSVGSLSGLKKLIVDECKALRQLPDSIGSLASLVTLDVRGCEALQHLPDSIGSLASLVTLDVSKCKGLRQLPDSIGSLARLVMLDVSGCEALQQLPDTIGSLASLVTLSVNGCIALQQLPDSIGSLAGLWKLDVSCCEQLQRLPDSIGHLATLLTLDFSNCIALQQLPDSIGCLASLVALDINKCIALQRLPDSIGHLAGIVGLDINGCIALQQLPDSIGSLSGLKTLIVNDCKALRQLPDSIGHLASLVTLDISSDKALQQLPDSIGSLASLATLDVSWCKALQQLPDNIGSLASLVTLDVSWCKALQQLPDNIGSLAGLVTLDVSWCEALQQLPDSIGSLAGLVTLDVSWCKALRQLPDSIGSLAGLVTLNISGCKALQQLPDSIGRLSSLVTLDVSRCEALQQLPDSIGCLASLVTLDVRGCEALQRLPDSIGSLHNLPVRD